MAMLSWSVQTAGLFGTITEVLLKPTAESASWNRSEMITWCGAIAALTRSEFRLGISWRI
jgi:hypothetical protein